MRPPPLLAVRRRCPARAAAALPGTGRGGGGLTPVCSCRRRARQLRIARIAIDHKARPPICVVSALSVWLALTGAAAQPVVKPGDGLRPLYATSSEVAEGKELADLSCSKCHGADGVSATKGVPNFAGQRPSYLYLK